MTILIVLVIMTADDIWGARIWTVTESTPIWTVLCTKRAAVTQAPCINHCPLNWPEFAPGFLRRGFYFTKRLYL